MSSNPNVKREPLTFNCSVSLKAGLVELAELAERSLEEEIEWRLVHSIFRQADDEDAADLQPIGSPPPAYAQ